MLPGYTPTPFLNFVIAITGNLETGISWIIPLFFWAHKNFEPSEIPAGYATVITLGNKWHKYLPKRVWK